MQEKIEIICEFKEDDHWDDCCFYMVYEEENEKYIKIESLTQRQLLDKHYHSWTELDLGLSEAPFMSLKEFCRWDKRFNLENMLEPFKYYWREEKYPEHAFMDANFNLTTGVAWFEEYQRRSGKTYHNIWAYKKIPGRVNLSFSSLNQDTPCGYYFTSQYVDGQLGV